MLKNGKSLVSIISPGDKKTVKLMKKSRSSRPVLICKKGVFILKISQKSVGNTSSASLFDRFTGLSCFHMNFVKFLTTIILQNICEPLFLKIMLIQIQLCNKWHNLLKQYPHISPTNFDIYYFHQKIAKY